MGRFEEAETLLAQRLDDLTDLPLASTHRAYNLGLLGKLYLEWDRPTDAHEPIIQSWQQVQQTGHISIRPLLRNYYAELLLHPMSPHADPTAAEALLTETVEECRRTGFVRSEVAALSMLADAGARRGDLAAARSHSAAALARLEQAGTLPALRAEEIYLIHARVLELDRDPDGAPMAPARPGRRRGQGGQHRRPNQAPGIPGPRPVEPGDPDLIGGPAVSIMDTVPGPGPPEVGTPGADRAECGSPRGRTAQGPVRSRAAGSATVAGSGRHDPT